MAPKPNPANPTLRLAEQISRRATNQCSRVRPPRSRIPMIPTKVSTCALALTRSGLHREVVQSVRCCQYPITSRRNGICIRECAYRACPTDTALSKHGTRATAPFGGCIGRPVEQPGSDEPSPPSQAPGSGLGRSRSPSWRARLQSLVQPPVRLPCINLELQPRSSVLAEEDGSHDLVFGAFAGFDLELEFLKSGTQDVENLVTIQSAFEILRPDSVKLRLKQRHHGRYERRRRLGAGECRETDWHREPH